MNGRPSGAVGSTMQVSQPPLESVPPGVGNKQRTGLTDVSTACASSAPGPALLTSYAGD